MITFSYGTVNKENYRMLQARKGYFSKKQQKLTISHPCDMASFLFK